jgi:hypothetical protein
VVHVRINRSQNKNKIIPDAKGRDWPGANSLPLPHALCPSWCADLPQSHGSSSSWAAYLRAFLLALKTFEFFLCSFIINDKL